MMNSTVSPKTANCSETQKTTNFSTLAFVLQAVLLNLTLQQVEGYAYKRNLVGTKLWNDGYYPTRGYYQSRERYNNYWDRPVDKHDVARFATYDGGAGYQGSYERNRGGERGWLQGNQDSRRQGQVSSGFSNSYSKNERGHSSQYYNDGSARSANRDYATLGSRYRNDGGSHERLKLLDQLCDGRCYWNKPAPVGWESPYRRNFWRDVSGTAKKTSLYFVPPPKTYYIDNQDEEHH